MDDVHSFIYDLRSWRLIDSRPKRRANLSKVHFQNVNLSEANLSFVDISRAEFSNPDLTKAHLEDADLSRDVVGWRNLEGRTAEQCGSVQGNSSRNQSHRLFGALPASTSAGSVCNLRRALIVGRPMATRMSPRGHPNDRMRARTCGLCRASLASLHPLPPRRHGFDDCPLRTTRRGIFRCCRIAYGTQRACYSGGR